jgi:cullin 1
MVKWMQRFFQYLDRFYVEMSSIASLTDQGFSQFKAEIFGRMVNPITDAVLQAIETDRRNEPIDTDLLK